MLSLIASLIAIVVSLYAVLLSRKTHRETLATATVDSLYEAFNGLSDHRIANWHLGHLFELPENYEHVRRIVTLSLGPVDIATMNELILKERALAIRIFEMFERVLYQQIQAQTTKDEARAKFLTEVLDYFTGRLLRNPRLLHLWDPAGESLCGFFEASTLNYYREKVTDKLPADCHPDRDGPYAIAQLKTTLPRPEAGPHGPAPSSSRVQDSILEPKWPIVSPVEAMSSSERRQYWEDQYARLDYSNVFSLTECPTVQRSNHSRPQAADT